MVRIYGSGIPGGDVKSDDFATQMSKERDAMLVASSNIEAKDGSSIGEQIVGFRTSVLSKFANCIFGDYFAHVIAIKTVEKSVEQFLDKPVGDALKKAVESLGYNPKSLLGICVRASSVSEAVDSTTNKSAMEGDKTFANKAGNSSALTATQINARTLRQIIELVDPLSVVALDKNASQMLKQGFEDTNVVHEINSSLSQSQSSSHSLTNLKDEVLYVNGRKHVFLCDFESSLNDIQAKRNAWAALRTLKRN